MIETDQKYKHNETGEVISIMDHSPDHAVCCTVRGEYLARDMFNIGLMDLNINYTLLADENA